MMDLGEGGWGGGNGEEGLVLFRLIWMGEVRRLRIEVKGEGERFLYTERMPWFWKDHRDQKEICVFCVNGAAGMKTAHL